MVLPGFPQKSIPEHFLQRLSGFGIMILLSLPQSGSREGVRSLYFIITFLLSVLAGIIAYYICKWIDRHGKGQ